ncbi:unnamed protein product [Phytomonas sp. Hart1]|nr:unnamed protein product [Phytomonas sp. Hart1]|eukprot:CCW68142.1 unnamed protein product [Phytomonas sp. isolate Hart1]
MPNNNTNGFGDSANTVQLIAAQRGRKVYRVRGQYFDIEDTYTITSVIGHGAYGVVCAALDDRTFQEIAIKHVNHVFEDLVDGRRIWREVLLLRLLKEKGCRNVLNLIRVLPSKTSITEFNDLYMVTDLYDVDFHSIIRQRRPILLDVLRKVTVHVLRCLSDMHSMGVVHRDIKPSNILLKMDKDLESAVVCDFGLARGGLHRLKDPSYLTDYVVTRWYRAPEVLLMAPYSYPVDIWALGCVMSEYIMQRPLFDGRDYIHQMQLVLSTVPITGTDFIERDCDTTILHLIEVAKRYGDTRPLSRLLASIPKDGLALVSKMLAFEPNKRITAQEALRHPFLESVEGLDSEKHPSPPEVDLGFDMHTDISECQLRRVIWNEIQHYKE